MAADCVVERDLQWAHQGLAAHVFFLFVTIAVGGAAFFGVALLLRIEELDDVAAPQLASPMLDLIDIATYVYVADQATPRGGAGVENAGAEWRRTARPR